MRTSRDSRSLWPTEGCCFMPPENTLANFRACLELRIRFEFDVQRTKDGALICLHDETLNRTTNGTGSVSERTLAEIRQLDAGSWFDRKLLANESPLLMKFSGCSPSTVSTKS